MGHKALHLFFLQALALKLLPGFLPGLAPHQGFGLGKKIGQQDVVMFTHGVQAAGKGDKIAWHEPGPLMQELEKCVLAVGAWFAPDNRSGGIIHLLAG